MPNQYRKYLCCVKRLNNIFNFKTKIFFNTHIYFWVLIIFFSLLKLFLLSGQHLFAIGYAAHDDGLFVKLASSLLKLNWLGDYNNLTLAKGPGYPIWIVFTFLLGIPLLLSQYLLYILACVTLIVALKPLFIKNYWFLIITYCVILFCPSSFSNQTARVLREGIYPALSLFIVAFSIGIFVRRNKMIKNITVWIVGLSIILPFFWLTREEGVWIMPFLVSILLFTIFKLWRERGKQWKLKSILLIIPFVTLLISVFVVSLINYYKYGIFATVEFQNNEFQEAYGSLTRVKDNKWQQFIPVSKEKMMKVYAVSPTFKKLKPFFDGDIGQGWAKFSTVQINREVGEIEGGWFMWAFRDAVAAAGYYKNGNDTQNYYKQLSAEIDTACRKKELDCFRKRVTMMDPFYKEQINPIIDSTIKTIDFLINFKGSEINQITSSNGDKDSLDLFSKITHEPVYVTNLDATNLEIRGWAFSPYEKIVLSIVNNRNELENYNVEFIDSLDVYTYYSKLGESFDNSKRCRFIISTSCKNNCFLMVTGLNNLHEIIPLDGKTTSSSSNKFYFHFDDSGIKQISKSEYVVEKVNEFKISILNNIGKLYRSLMFYIIILSLLIFITSSLIKKMRVNDLYLINTFLLFSIFTRIIILSVISAMSFNAININYLSPLHPMILIFVILNLFSLKTLFSKKTKNDLN